VIAATDFFSVEVWTARGLVTYHILFLIKHAIRAIHIAGSTTNPNSAFMAQVARNLTMLDDGFLDGMSYLILDHDTKFTAEFKGLLESAGVKIVPISYQAPNMNAFAERWVRSVKDECLGRMILFGEKHLHRALDEYVAHYHSERAHQGLGNVLVEPDPDSTIGGGEVVETERLGGLLRSYQRAA